MSAIHDLKLLSANDVGRELGVDRTVVSSLLRSGSLPGVLLTDRWYVEAGDLEEFARTYERPRRPSRKGTDQRTQRSEQSRRAIVATLADWNEATPAEIAQVIELHPGNVRKYLVLMEKAGLTQRVGEGLWALTDEGLASVPEQAQAS